MMCSRCHQVIGELVIANRDLQDVIGLYQELIGNVSEQAYESFAAGVGLPPERRRWSADSQLDADQLLAALRGAHDG
jgi:hypothetical protein